MKKMNRKLISLVVGALLFALSFPVDAQQATKVYRVGFLSSGADNTSERQAVLRGLRELGYVEGKNIIVEWGHRVGFHPSFFKSAYAFLIRV
jgi:hypothetical protein